GGGGGGGGAGGGGGPGGQPLDAGDELGERQQPPHLDHLEEAELERDPRVGGRAHLGLGLGQEVEDAQQVLLGIRGGERAHAQALLENDRGQEHAPGGGGPRGQQVAEGEGGRSGGDAR